jgi:hypothetical protein
MAEDEIESKKTEARMSRKLTVPVTDEMLRPLVKL